MVENDLEHKQEKSMGNDTQKKLSLEERLTILEEKVANIKVRDRGPKSSRAMTQDDATLVQKGGDLEKLSHMEAAKKLGLSYGQIYSARNGYTFQNRTS